MRQQYAATQASTELVQSHISTPGRMGRGNANNLGQMNLVNDLQAWLTVQAELIGSMPSGAARDQRAFGTLAIVSEASRAFQRGEPVDVSSLPMAPTAAEMPAIAGLLPAFSEMIRPHVVTRVADDSGKVAGRLFGQNQDTSADSKDSDDTAEDERDNKSLQEIKDQIMALKLKLPGETQTFSLKRYGDAESVSKILQHCVQCGIKSPDQVAYILATAWHESRLGKWMTESGWLSEKSAERYAEKKYGPSGDNPARAKRHGHTEEGDGGRYMGRGYVQLTWKDNYERMSGVLIDDGFTYTQDGVTYGNGKGDTTEIDLVANYQHVNRNKDLAARILVLGMDGGHYVGNGKGLDDYIPEGSEASHSDFEDGRKIVNGSDKKTLIADNAVTIQDVLRKDSAWTSAYNVAKGNVHGP